MTTMRQAVLAAIPTDADVSARQVLQRADMGAISGIYHYLREFVDAGVIVVTKQGYGGNPHEPTLYRRRA